MQLHWPPPNRSFGVVDALGMMGVMGFAVARFIPIATLVPFWGCVIRRTTGWPCPGCGLTRVAERVAHLNIPGAFAANPLGTLAALVFVAAIALSFLHLTFRMPLPQVTLTPRDHKFLRVGLVVALLLNYAFVVLQTRFPGTL